MTLLVLKQASRIYVCKAGCVGAKHLSQLAGGIQILSRNFRPCSSTGRRLHSSTAFKQSEEKSGCGGRDPDNSYDVIIAGGGLVGTALACLLGKEPMLQDQKVLLLEGAPKQVSLGQTLKEYSNRVSSVTPGTRKLLEECGAWKHIENMRYKPYTKMHVWDACGAGFITFNANEIERAHSEDGDNRMAYIIENSVIQSSLAKEFADIQSNVHIEYGCRIRDVIFPPKDGSSFDDLVSVCMEDGTTYNAKLLVGADGINSLVRSKAQMKYVKHDYQQSCVVATLHLDKQESSNNIAWQRFLPTGPIAMLPQLFSNQSSLAWSTTTENAKALVEMHEDDFVDAINTAFWEDCDRHPLVDRSGNLFLNMLSAIQPGTFAGSQLEQPPSVCGIDVKSRASYPLGLGHASHYVNNRVALIGDAAHRVHPLAGQGLNLGAGDVACLKNVLVGAVEDGEDIGDLNHLLRFETLRQREVVPMMLAVDAMKRLFSTSSTPFVLARTIGLQATNALKPLKDQFIAFAMK
eukprot:gene20125-22097_t